ncbi:MAG: hypothetical protein IK080_02295, partial [Clostridia bacterium]|nr:hypothetical protein [Clostridia bacterium]
STALSSKQTIFFTTHTFSADQRISAGGRERRAALIINNRKIIPQVHGKNQSIFEIPPAKRGAKAQRSLLRRTISPFPFTQARNRIIIESNQKKGGE